MIPSQMLKGLLEGCILEIIRQEETYAYVISKELAKCGFGEISEGTIYPIILRLQKKELISATTKESESGPARKYYKLTEEGERELTEFKGNWSELNTAVNQLLSIRSEQAMGMNREAKKILKKNKEDKNYGKCCNKPN